MKIDKSKIIEGNPIPMKYGIGSGATLLALTISIVILSIILIKIAYMI